MRYRLQILFSFTLLVIIGFSSSCLASQEDINSTAMQRGLAYFEEKNYELAFNEFTEAIDRSIESKQYIAYANRAWTSYKLKEFRLALGDYDMAISLCVDRKNLASLYKSRASVEKALGYLILAQRDKARSEFLSGAQSSDLVPYLTDASVEQGQLIIDFGKPDTFTLIFAREDFSGLLPPVRYESWRYNRFNTEFFFIDGEFIGADDIADLPDGTLLADYLRDPIFNQDYMPPSTVERSFRGIDNVADVGRFKLPKEFLQGQGLAGEQMLAGFNGEELLYLETLSLRPFEEPAVAGGHILHVLIAPANAGIRLRPKQFFRFIGKAIRLGFERGLAPLKLQVVYQLIKTGRNHDRVARELRNIARESMEMHNNIVLDSQADYDNGSITLREYQAERIRAERFLRESNRLVQLGHEVNDQRTGRALLKTAAAIAAKNVTQTRKFKKITDHAKEVLSKGRSPLQQLEKIVWQLPNMASGQLQNVISDVSDLASKLQFINLVLGEIRVKNDIFANTRYGLYTFENWLLNVKEELKAVEANKKRFDKNMAKKISSQLNGALALFDQAEELIQTEVERTRELNLADYGYAAQLTTNPQFNEILKKTVMLKKRKDLSALDREKMKVQAKYIYKQLLKAGIPQSDSTFETVFLQLWKDIAKFEFWRELHQNPQLIQERIKIYYAEAAKIPVMLITLYEIEPALVERSGTLSFSVELEIIKLAAGNTVSASFQLDDREIRTQSLTGPYDNKTIDLSFDFTVPSNISLGRHSLKVKIENESGIIDEHEQVIEVVASETQEKVAVPEGGENNISSEKDKNAWCEWYGMIAVKQFYSAGCEREGGAWNDDPEAHKRFCMSRGIEAGKNEITRRNRPGAAWGKYGDMQGCRERKPGE